MHCICSTLSENIHYPSLNWVQEIAPGTPAKFVKKQVRYDDVLENFFPFPMGRDSVCVRKRVS